MTKPSITMPVAELDRLLTPVLPMAAVDDSLPVLHATLIEVRNGDVLAWATDRFKAGLSRVPGEFASVKGDFRALLDIDDAAHMLKLFKPARRPAAQAAQVRLTLDGSMLYAEPAGGLFGFSDLRVGYRLLDGTYPDVRSLLVDRLRETGTPISGITVNADFLARFKAAERHDAACSVDLPTKPRGTLLVRVGDRFVGVLMPKSSEPTPLSAWVELLTTTPKEGAA